MKEMEVAFIKYPSFCPPTLLDCEFSELPYPVYPLYALRFDIASHSKASPCLQFLEPKAFSLSLDSSLSFTYKYLGLRCHTFSWTKDIGSYKWFLISLSHSNQSYPLKT